jgi:mRNA interferase HigB
MKIVGRDKLEVFCSRYADARPWLEAWLHEVEGMAWASPQELKNRYATASFLSRGRVILNVRGNNYRMEVIVAYKVGVVTVIWIGTHRDYDRRNRRR